jgi:ABC-type branched-subunit amino acid transport system substrate-binding protein
MTSPDPLRLTGRGRTYGTISAAVAVTLALGLAVPLAFGEQRGDVVRAEGPAADLSGFTDPGGTAPGAAGEATDVVDGQAPAVDAAGPLAPGAPGAGAAPDAAGGPAAGGPAAAAGTAGPAAGPAAGQAAGSAPLTASDVGVTPTSIKVGVQIPDVRALEAAGYAVGPGDAERQWAAVFDEVNRNGGVNGRKVEYVFKAVDAIDQARMRQACLEWADEKVFAVVGSNGYYGPAVDCVIQEKKIPFLHNQQGTAVQYRAASTRYFTTAMQFDRTLKNWADFLQRTGALRGQTVGVMYPASTAAETAAWNAFVADLQRLGASKVVPYSFSPEVQTAAGQVPAAVAQFQREGVTAVLNGIIFLNANQFVTQAEAQRATWRYYTSDVADATLDFAAQRMPDSFDGAIGMSVFRNGDSRSGVPEPAFERACIDRYRAVPGAQDRSDRGTTPHAHTRIVCTLASTFVAAAQKAGPQLTRDGWAAAMQALGERNDLPGLGGTLLAPGRNDMANQLRPMQWSKSCRCWSPVRGASFYKAPF